MSQHARGALAALLATALGCGAAPIGPGPSSDPPIQPPPEDGVASGRVPSASACERQVGRGVAAREAGRREEAARAFARAVREDRGCAAAFLGLAVLQREAGRVDDALVNVRRALAVDSQNVHAFHQLVLVHLAEAEGDVSALDRAALACRQGMQIDPAFAPLHNTCGVVDADGGRIVEALARFERAFTLDPELFEAWMNFGHVTLSFRGYEDAERAFRAALATRPGDYDAHIGLGIALRGLGRVEEARERYEHARRLAPERPEAWYNLGILHQEHLAGSVEDLERATTYFETFVAKADGAPEYTDAVEDVVRCCPPRGSGRAAQACRPGRLSNLRAAIEALGGARSAAARC